MTQRAGRAGRLSPGICLHLLGKEQAERAAAQSEPEILHSDLSALLLELLQWGCHDPAALARLDQPPAVNLAAARRLLEALSALDGERLSAFGRKMAALGNEPRLAAMLAAAQTDDEAATAAKLAAILEEAARRTGGFGGRLFPSAGQLAAASAAADETPGLPRRPARCRANGGCWRRPSPIASPAAAVRRGATSWRTAWARCWTPTTRWAVMNGLSLRCCCRAALRRMPACCWLCQWKSAS